MRVLGIQKKEVLGISGNEVAGNLFTQKYSG
jgi:hypothetical protein